MRKIPAIPPGADAKTVAALAKTVQYVTGQNAPVIQPLASTATTAQIIAKINEVIARMQGE